MLENYSEHNNGKWMVKSEAKRKIKKIESSFYDVVSNKAPKANLFLPIIQQLRHDSNIKYHSHAVQSSYHETIRLHPQRWAKHILLICTLNLFFILLHFFFFSLSLFAPAILFICDAIFLFFCANISRSFLMMPWCA